MMQPITNKQSCLHIMHAGNIGRLMERAVDEYHKVYPDVTVSREKGGSVSLARKAALRKVHADIVATADYANIRDFLYGKHADWYGTFATTSMVLVYSDNSRFSDVITKDNWHEVISGKGVKIKWGDPDVDPGAYRRIMIGKLAEKYYRMPGLAKKIEANVTCAGDDGASHAIPMARGGRVDYVFMYRPAAIANGLAFLELPPPVNLGDPRYRDFYRTVDAASSGARVQGDLILYGITVMKNSPYEGQAIKFVELLLGPDGERIVRDCGFAPVKPFRAAGAVPPALKKFM